MEVIKKLGYRYKRLLMILIYRGGNRRIVGRRLLQIIGMVIGK